MCALAHCLESAGIATIAISLIRLHSEIIRPPRALFVPFELGRPMGDPGDVATQREVVTQALSLLDHVGPDAVLRDFPDPVVRPEPLDWQPDLALPGGEIVNGVALVQEFAAVHPAYLATVAQNGRTTFGNSALSPKDVIGVMCDLLDGGTRDGKRLSGKVIRFVIDDLKSLYFEAACLNAPPTGSARLNTWFWTTTIAGKAIAQLRRQFQQSDDKSRRMIANFMVPGEWVDKLGLTPPQ